MRATAFALLIPLALAACDGKPITGPDAQRLVAKAKPQSGKLTRLAGESMSRRSRVEVVVIGCLSLSASPLGAQAVDMAVMAKWSAVTVVHYVMTGDFTGELVVMKSPRGVDAKAKVTDRVELTFNWNQHAMALVGAATVKNFPATVAFPAPTGECPVPRITTPYEGWDIVSVTGFGGGVTLAGKRTYAAGAFPRARPNVPASQEVCGEVW